MGQTGPTTPSATTHSLFTAYLSGFCKCLQSLETPRISLVMRLGQRFESARRLSLVPANASKSRISRTDGGALAAVGKQQLLLRRSLAVTFCPHALGSGGCHCSRNNQVQSIRNGGESTIAP